jgi:peptide/nickel transport system substrate-binding protein
VTRRDAGVVLVLVAVLAVLAGTVAAPSFAPAATASPSPTAALAADHVEGIVGHPSSINPLTARTQADRDLVALLFRGLVRLGAGNTVLPDLADRWTVTEKGARWTFHIRPDAWWHDGVQVTSADVVYTVGVLHDPDYAGPLAATWAQVGATALDPQTVQFDLGDPVGGFLQAAALPLLPAHILAGVPVAALADDPFATEPIGTGAFALVELTREHAVLEPVLPSVAVPAAPLDDPAAGQPAARVPRLARLELRFFDTADALEAAFATGEIGSAGDLPPAAAVGLATSTPGARAIKYPTTTLTAVTFNLRSPRGPFADARSRRALLAAVDRRALIASILGGAGVRADTPIPPSSWAYDEKAAPEVSYDRSAAAKGLRDAGWKRSGDAWLPPGATKPLEVTILAPQRSANPIAQAAAARVAAAWTSIGLAATVRELAPGDFVARLRKGDYQVAIVDVNMGLDPDPYPILASTQAREGGANVSGIQEATLDAALVAARAPGSMASRKRAYHNLQALLGTLQPMPALFFRDSVLVAGSGLAGPAARPISDPGDRFWDVIRWVAGR